MEMISGGDEPSVCKASQLSEYVDDQLNGGARREFEEATSETQGFGADLGEVGSKYLEDDTVTFAARSVACALCKGTVRLSQEGSVTAGQCPVSGSCELEWAQEHPANYTNEHGNIIASQVRCAAEIGCGAVISLEQVDGDIRVSLTRGSGVCEVEKRGIGWREEGAKAWGTAELQSPEMGIPAFDGEDSDRESAE